MATAGSADLNDLYLASKFSLIHLGGLSARYYRTYSTTVEFSHLIMGSPLRQRSPWATFKSMDTDPCQITLRRVFSARLTCHR